MPMPPRCRAHTLADATLMLFRLLFLHMPLTFDATRFCRRRRLFNATYIRFTLIRRLRRTRCRHDIDAITPLIATAADAAIRHYAFAFAAIIAAFADCSPPLLPPHDATLRLRYYFATPFFRYYPLLRGYCCWRAILFRCATCHYYAIIVFASRCFADAFHAAAAIALSMAAIDARHLRAITLMLIYAAYDTLCFSPLDADTPLHDAAMAFDAAADYATIIAMPPALITPCRYADGAISPKAIDILLLLISPPPPCYYADALIYLRHMLTLR